MNKIGIFTAFKYSADVTLDHVIGTIMDCFELSDVRYLGSWMTLYFGESIVLEVWNSNKYYAWLAEGKVWLHDKLIYSWDCSRPKRKTMNRLIMMLNGFVTDRMASTLNENG